MFVMPLFAQAVNKLSEMMHLRGGIKDVGKKTDSAEMRKRQKEIRQLKGDLQQVCSY